ncbi:sarcosine oxidase subunit gamma [Denitrobaculum tricleocarpae]|nr:sarcosine oxidase subunit gamma family protein [Denitrobaculum tricleocarpae]
MSSLVYALAETARPGVYGASRAEGPGLELLELRPATMLQLGAWPDTKGALEAILSDHLKLEVPVTPGQAAVSPEGTLMVMAPGRYLLVSDNGDITQSLLEKIAVETGVLTDLSHARAGIRISGRNAADVLLKGVVIDLDIRAFTVGSVAQSSFHHVGLTLHRKDETTFDLFVFRGFAVSFWEALTDAALEYGYEVMTPA